MRIKTTVAVLSAAALLALAPTSALAHDDSWVLTGGIGDVFEFTHVDASPWAGWINVEITNTGTEPWGDFHIGIFDPIGTQDVSNVDFVVDPPYEPTSSQSPLTWSVDNSDPAGALIDLYFYSDPVDPNETATFSVYNVNPDQLTSFGVCFYPTPVPEPAALVLLSMALVVRRR